MNVREICMESSWHELLKEEFQKEYILELRNYLAEEVTKHEVYPPNELIFNAFCQTTFEDVKIVIMGQDPYHGRGQAHGLSFSVPEGVEPPPSLKNIFKELVDDVKIRMPQTGCLLPWAKQGILLLNATLTVRANEPMSHHNRGWEIFTDVVIDKLAARKDPLVFLLWGKSAQEKCKRVLDRYGDAPHLILCASHPSFYSARQGFFGCRHFSKANEFLRKMGKQSVDWNL